MKYTVTKTCYHRVSYQTVVKKGQADNYMQSFSDKMNCDKAS